MKSDFKSLEMAMAKAMTVGGALEMRAQRALIALLESRLGSAERLFWSLQAEINEVNDTSNYPHPSDCVRSGLAHRA